MPSRLSSMGFVGALLIILVLLMGVVNGQDATVPADTTVDSNEGTTLPAADDLPTGDGLPLNNSDATTDSVAPSSEVPTDTTDTMVSDSPSPSPPPPTTLPPVDDANTNGTSKTLERSNSTSVAIPEDTQEPSSAPNTSAPTKTISLVVETPAPTNVTPSPPINGEDRIKKDYEYMAYAVFDVSLSEFTLNVDSFAATYILPAMPKKLKPFLSSIILLNYCSMNPKSATEENMRNWGCTSYSNRDTDYTWVNFAFYGSTSKSNYTSLELEKLPLVKVNDNADRLFVVVENVIPEPSPAPGIVSRAAQSAGTPGGIAVVLLLLVFIMCICVFAIKRCRAKDDPLASDGTPNPQYANVGGAHNNTASSRAVDYENVGPVSATPTPNHNATPAGIQSGVIASPSHAAAEPPVLGRPGGITNGSSGGGAAEMPVGSSPQPAVRLVPQPGHEHVTNPQDIPPAPGSAQEMREVSPTPSAKFAPPAVAAVLGGPARPAPEAAAPAPTVASSAPPAVRSGSTAAPPAADFDQVDY